VKRQLTEAQAWREIARRLDEGEPMTWGLCAMARCLMAEDIISEDRCTLMRMRAISHVHMVPWSERSGSFAYPRGEERDARILAALWMALEAEEGLEP